MKHLAGEWSKVTRRIKGKAVYLFLDFDGTLTPIRKQPEAVRLSGATRKALKRLISCEDVFVSVISGRALGKIGKLVGIKGIIYAGNHGLEAEGPGFKFTAPGSLRAKKAVTEIKKRLKKELKFFKGALVEDKGLSLSVHFRMVSKGKQGEVKRIFKKTTAPYEAAGKIVVTEGKKVLEVRPPVKWDKGKIVSLLLTRKKKKRKKAVVPFYIGDDKTDEDAFRALGSRAYAVKIGNPGGKSTSAGYYLQGAKEVREFLKKILNIKRGERYV